MSMDLLKNICDGSQYHLIINRRYARYKICGRFKQRQAEWKEVLLSAQNMGKGLHKVLKAVVNDILQALTVLGEPGSEVSYFIPEPRNFAEATRLSYYIKKPWIKATLKEIKNLINDQNSLVQDLDQGGPATPCMDVYKAKIQSDGS